MARERLTLEALVERGRFDAGNRRHRRALDESGSLEDPEREQARQQVLSLRGSRGARVRGAQALREFARLVAGHARASMSLDVYSHVMPPDEVAAERLQTLIITHGRVAPS
jgi:hypothetical protein